MGRDHLGIVGFAGVRRVRNRQSGRNERGNA
jgi:hypothetical protein